MRHADCLPLRVHSAYSLAESAIKLEKLFPLAREHGYPAVGFADSVNVFGALEICQLAQDHGIQPLLGVEIPVRIPALEQSQSPAARLLQRLPRLVLQVQSPEGWISASRLISQAWLRESPAGGGLAQAQVPAEPHVTLQELSQATEGLLCLTGGIDGPIATLLTERRMDAASALLQALAGLFPDRLYLEITRTGQEGESLIEPQLLDLADHHALPLIGTCPAYFLKAQDHAAQDVLICIKENKPQSDPQRRRMTPEQYVRSPAQLRDLFADLPECLDNTLVLAERCHYILQKRKEILPRFPTPADKSEDEALAEMAEAGLRARLADRPDLEQIWPTYRDRLGFELGVISRMGFPGYFLIVADFIQWAKRQGIPVGPGRGSGAASVVAWALTITDLDPLEYGLLFERFLNPERVSMPDFDIDFCQDRRDEVIAYVCRKYGADRVAQIVTLSKLKARAVLRGTGRVMALPLGLVDRLAKMIPDNPTRPVTLAQAIAADPLLQEEARRNPSVDAMFKVAQELEGLYSNASTHAAGVVIGDRPLVELVPLYRDPGASMPATQFNMKHVEQVGLVKFDFLGLKTLTVLREAETLLAQRQITVDLGRLPLEDDKVYRMLSRGESAAVFQLEGSGMRDTLRQLRPNRFADIIALVALYRPGPMEFIPQYIAVKEGRAEPDYMHPLLEPILRETYGIMVYQEQVMQAAQILAGYSLGGADLLRRAMGKKIKSAMDAERAKFIAGAAGNGIGAEQASAIFDRIAKFADYGFNKPHAAAYAFVSWQTAWLKANHPVEFWAATMTLDRDNTDKLAICKQELQRSGIPLLPPDVTESHVRFSVGRTEAGEPAIRYALSAIKGVGEQAMQALVAERERGGPFRSLDDFLRRMAPAEINRRVLENLIRAGALDRLCPERGRLMAQIDRLVRQIQASAEEKGSSQSALFALGGSGSSLPALKLEPRPDWSLSERLEQERIAIGFYLSAHPLDEAQAALAGLDLTTWKDLVQTGRPGGTLAAMVHGRRERTSARGSRYAFIQMEDTTGRFEVTAFEEVLRASRDLLEPKSLVLVRVEAKIAAPASPPPGASLDPAGGGDGAGDRAEGEARLTALEIKPLDAALAERRAEIEIRLDQASDLPKLKEALVQGRPGKTRILLVLPVKGQQQEALVALDRRLLVDAALKTRLTALGRVTERLRP